MAEKINTADGVLVKGTSGADSIENSGSFVTINAGAGNDSIDNWWGDNVTIDGGAGNDYIYSYGDKVLFKYSGGNDTIAGFKSNSTLKIASGTLNSIVKSDGYDYFLSVGENKITLKDAAYLAYLDKVNIVDSKGKAVDFTVKADFKTTDDNDSVINYLDNVSINAGKGNDFIRNDGNKITINGGDGDDSIENSGDRVTINGGAGNDDIYSYGDKVLFKYSGGNDTIAGFKSNSTLKIASGTLNSVITSDGYDYFLTVGENKITLEGAADLDKVNIVDSKGKSVNFMVKADFNITDGDDSIVSYLNNISINAGAGNDSIDNVWGKSVTIDGGAGNDSIDNSGNSVTINGGAGKDTIRNYGDSVTIDGGAGNDYIFNSNYSENVLFVYSGGNDSISGFNATSTLKIASGDLDSIIISNNSDFVLAVGKNKITLEGAASLNKINIVDSKGNPISFKDKFGFKVTDDNDSLENHFDRVLINSGAGKDTIKNYGANVTINGGAGNDSIYNESSLVSINGGAGNDSIYNIGDSVTIGGSAGNDSIHNSGDSVTINGGAGNDSLYGGSGKEVFVYKPNEGTDTIFDLAAGDMLKILKSDGTAGGFTSSTFKSGNLTLAIDGGGTVIFDSVSKGDKFKINGTTYTISGTKLVRD